MRPLVATCWVVLGLQSAVVADRVEATWSTQTPLARAASQVTSTIRVTLPKDDAELLVNDKSVGSKIGAIRTFDTSPLESGQVYAYKFTTIWAPNTYTVITRNATVRFRAGDAVTVDLTKDDSNDRARIRYVPTTDAIVDEMIKLAGISQDDVVFEPGCGDSRITIAAVKAGARRGIGIDIDPERVAESQQNVRAAGLEERIEIRLGDALDIKDLSDATVVFLYMGDEFGRLMQPLLVKQLKVGTRVVSHRFTLGDWTPDQTVTVIDLGIPYLLHVWTVTDQVKARVANK
jgi:uncharacterized protein (TIGR03000 family)